MIPEPKKKRETKVAEAEGTYKVHQFDILAIIEARNDQEDLKGKEFVNLQQKSVNSLLMLEAPMMANA